MQKDNNRISKRVLNELGFSVVDRSSRKVCLVELASSVSVGRECLLSAKRSLHSSPSVASSKLGFAIYHMVLHMVAQPAQ